MRLCPDGDNMALDILHANKRCIMYDISFIGGRILTTPPAQSNSLKKSSELPPSWSVHLTTAPPAISLELAEHIADVHFGLDGQWDKLPGERDCNYLISQWDNTRVILKFINPSESIEETDFQVAVLEHLAQKSEIATTPIALTTRDGKPHHTCCEPGAEGIVVRAYTYLEGISGSKSIASSQLRESIGRELATLDSALLDFWHPGADRDLMWDVTRLSSLTTVVPISHISITLNQFLDQYVPYYTEEVLPKIRRLPRQIIHNDMTPSNYLVSEHPPQHVCGILDMGDMVYAPKVADLAIAASYQMNDAENPLQAIREVMQGYHAVNPLNQQEISLVLDLVIARLVQRLIITEWRAKKFPENRKYILRANPDARHQLTRLSQIWAPGRQLL